MSEHVMLDFSDPARRKRLRQAYDAAIVAGQDQFTFDGHPLLVDYAYYLLEHLANVAGDPNLKPERRTRGC